VPVERNLPLLLREPITKEQGMAHARNWEKLGSEPVGDFDVFRVRRTKLRSPRTGDVHEFHVLDVPLCVKVIPITDDGRVVMVEQFRQGVERVTLEFPAGVMEEGENPVEAALRELEEETGYCAGSAELLAEFDPDPAIQSNTVHVVVARDCRPTGQRHQDETEDVVVQLARVDEVPGLIRDGRIRHAVAIGAWYHYAAREANGGTGAAAG
jgi:ADP-ribose pyrophosphatase